MIHKRMLLRIYKHARESAFPVGVPEFMGLTVIWYYCCNTLVHIHTFRAATHYYIHHCNILNNCSTSYRDLLRSQYFSEFLKDGLGHNSFIYSGKLLQNFGAKNINVLRKKDEVTLGNRNNFTCLVVITVVSRSRTGPRFPLILKNNVNTLNTNICLSGRIFKCKNSGNEASRLGRLMMILIKDFCARFMESI